MKRPHLLLLLTATAALAATSAGAARTPYAADSSVAASCGTPTIAFMGPITGPAAFLGTEQRNFAKFFITRWNKFHPKQRFKLIEGDTQLSAAQASTIAQRFVSNRDILAIVGPAGSQEVQASGPLFVRAGMAFVSASATRADLTNGTLPTFFRVVGNDTSQARTDANFMVDVLNVRKVFVIDDQTSYSVGLADSAERVLRTRRVKTRRESVSQTQTDFSALVAKVPGDTDVVFLPWQIAANAQLFGQQMKEQGKTARLFGGDGLQSAEFKIDGSYVSAFARDIRGVPANAALVKSYFAQFGKNAPFQTFGPPVFVATQVVVNAITRACRDGKATRPEVAEEVARTRLSTSILGHPIRFDFRGDVTGEGSRFYIFQIRKGEFVAVQ